MKEIKVILWLIFWMLCLLTWVTISPVSAYSQEIDLEIIKQIESGGDPHAYNKRSGATGLYQITPICLKDYDRFQTPQDCTRYGIEYSVGTCKMDDFTMDDMYDPAKNYRVAN